MAAAPIVTLENGAPPTSPQFWLDAATQAVRNFCGWHIAPVIEETAVLDGHGGRLLVLPTLKLVEVASVLNDGVQEVGDDLDASEIGMLELRCHKWTRRLGGIVIEYTHGYELDDIADVAGVIAKLAARAATSASNITRQNAGGMGVSYGTTNGLPPGIDLLQAEKDLLRSYRVWTR